MSVAYYGSKISPHLTKTPEGFLICHDVPINRIGVQKYNGYEIGQDAANSTKMFKVIRRPEEVFSPAAIASFNGKPITDGHPPENVTPDNIHAFERGHAQNIRKGTGDNEGCTIADLYITDPQLINDVMDGKREVSCGYNYDLFPNKNGTFEQRSIRGNHIAVVEEGRAGHHVAIKDSKPKTTERGTKMTENKGSLRGRVMKVFALDESTTPEDLALLHKMKDPEAKDELPEKEEMKPEVKAEVKGEAPATDELLKKVIEMLGELKTCMAPKEPEDELEDLIDPRHEASETPEQESEEHMTGHEDETDESPEEQEPSVTVPAEELEEKTSMDAARQVAIGVRKVLQKSIKDPKAYKAAAKDAAATIRSAYGIRHDNSGYSAFAQKTAEYGGAKVAKDAKVLAGPQAYQEAQNAYDALNPQMNKGVK